MKKLLFLISGALFMGALTAQSLPNGGFESWGTNTWADPQYYTTSNDQDVPNGFPANVTETAGYLGINYGVKIQTIGTPPNTIPGFCIDADVNNTKIPTGGIPYSQKPTGIRFYYQYAPGPKDTAAVIIIFKKLGILIDSFLIALPVAENAYTLHSYYPKNPLPIAPDTVIVGAVSSIKILNNGGGGNLPVGSTLIIDSITFTGVSSQPAELNGDFQQWVTNTMLFPNGWYINYPNTTRTTDAASGNYAIQMETGGNPLNGIQPGQAGTGTYPQNCNGNCNEIGGYAYSLTPSKKDTLEFDYKYAPMPNDTAGVFINFVKNGQIVFGTQGSYIKNQSTYTAAQIAFDLTGVNPVPDTVIVNMTSSAHNHDTTNAQYMPYVGSTFKVDNMTFASQKATLGINSLSVATGIKVYPNPANSQLNIDLTNISGSLQMLALYDMSGRLLSSQTYSGEVRNTLETIDISNFAAGMYLVEATTSNGKFYQKVCKN